MDEKILAIFRDTFELADVTVMVSQKNCEKWDSLNHLNLIINLESEFDVSFEPEEMREIVSFEAVKKSIMSKIK